MAVRPTNLFPRIGGNIRGDVRLRKKLAALGEGLMGPIVVARIEKLLLERTRRRFITKTDPAGRPWAPLKYTTVARRHRRRMERGFQPSAFGIAHGGILVLTGSLANSIRILWRGERARFTASPTGGGFRIGTDHPAARAHQRGNRANGTPQRRFLGTGIADAQAVERLMLRVARTAGLR